MAMSAARRPRTTCSRSASWPSGRASPSATVRHYLREGLLPEPVKTSRNMAYYPPEFVERIRLIKQLQEERFMPLKVIRELLASGDGDPERLRALVELEDRILERALAGERERVPADEVGAATRSRRRSSTGSPSSASSRPTHERLLAVRRPDRRGDRRFRAGGYDETDRLHRLRHPALQAARWRRWSAEEVKVLTERLAGDVDPERAIEMIEAGVGPLNELISALHTKLLVAELERRADEVEEGT